MSETDKANKENIKILLVGDQAVGKSSLMCRYVDNIFNFSLMGTAGLDLKKKKVVINDKEILVYIYDTAGQERFRNIAYNQYKNSQGILIVYDVTDRKTFEGVNDWVKSLQDYGAQDKEIIIIGNKIDLVKQRVVDTEEGEILADKLQAPFIETSAKDSINVEEGFMTIIQKIYDRQNYNNTQSSSSRERKKPKPNTCCYAAS